MTPKESYAQEVTVATRDAGLSEWVARGAEPYLVPYYAPSEIVGHGAEWPAVGATFAWLGESWRVVDMVPDCLGLVVRKDGPSARRKLLRASWWAKLPRWLGRCISACRPIARRFG